MEAKAKSTTDFERQLLRFDELPEYLKDNEFILDYYRSEWPLKHILWSVFSWHNDTLNIWTYMTSSSSSISFAISANATATFNRFSDIRSMDGDELDGDGADRASWFDLEVLLPLQKSHRRHVSENGAEQIPRWPWFVFLGGAMTCLICSSLSHLFACQSKRFNHFWRLDYTGISIMIVSSFYAPIYYAFFCNTTTRFFYLTSISLLGALSITALLSPAFSSPLLRSLRTSVFITIAFLGIILATHAAVLHWNNPCVVVAIGYELAMALLYLKSAAFYISRMP